MKRFKIFTAIYFTITILFVLISLKLDEKGMCTGSNFHELSSINRNLLRVTSVSTIIATPTCLIGEPYIGGKPQLHAYTHFKRSLILWLSIIPSYLFYVYYLGRWSKFKELIRLTIRGYNKALQRL